MQRDLGATDGEVHAEARRVLDFWFGKLTDAQRFGKSDVIDRAIAERFGELRARVIATNAIEWRADPRSLLAAIILIDQFSRNLFRGAAEAFTHDPLARELTRFGIERGWDQGMTADERQFLYMPLMHAEDSALQQLSLEKFAAPGLEGPLEFARAHADVIARFGRFPSRNAALGRPSTPEERDYLSQPGAGW